MIKAPPKRATVVAVSHEYKIAYVSIAKAASSSIKDYFIKNLNGEIEVTSFVTDKLWYKKFDDYFTFSIVREPIDRLFSCYKNKILSPNNIDKETGVDVLFKRYNCPAFNNKMSFKEFLEALQTIDPKIYDPHFRSQHEFLCDRDNNVVVDFVGKVESINADFCRLIEERGLPDCELPSRNKISIDISYDDEATSLAMQVYGVKQDKEIFNYI